MQLKLRILVGGNAGQKLAIPGPVFTIGRDDGCDLRPKSGYISRRHCEIAQENSRAFIKDLRSRTGTWINGSRIPTERAVEMQAGDHLKLGPLEFEVVFSHGVGGKKKPKVESVQEATVRAAEVAESEKEVDVSQWLLEDDGSALNGDTLGANPSPTIISAADLIAQAGKEAERQKEKVENDPNKADPRKAADEALRSLLRRG